MRWPLSRRGWRAALAVAALPVATLLVLALFEIRIPADFLRERIEHATRAASGLELRIEGRVHFVTGLRPGLEVSQVVVESAAPAAKLELLRFGTGRVEIEPVGLLARELRIRRVHAADLVLRFDDAALEALASAGSRAAARPAAGTEDGWRLIGLRTLQVERARVIGGLSGLAPVEEFSLDALTLHAPASEPLTIEASGTFAGEAVKIALRTASFDELRGGAQAIPIQVRIAVANASLHLQGTHDREARRSEYDVAASARGDVLERALPQYRAALAGMHEASVEGRVRASPGDIAFDATAFGSGRTRGRGEFHWSAGAGRARARARLEFETLDLAPWLEARREPPAAPPPQDDALELIRRMQRVADVTLDMKAAALTWPGRAARDARLALRAGKDAVTLDAGARLHTGTLRAKARLESAQPEAQLVLEVQGGPLALERLHPSIERAGFAGVARSAKLVAKGRGAQLAALVESAEGELELSKLEARWRREGRREPHRVAIERAQLIVTRDAMRGVVQATVADAGIVLNLSGTRAAIVPGERMARGDFEVTVRRSRRPGLQLAARGALTLDRRAWAVELKDTRLGQSRGSATLKGAWRGEAPMALRAALDQLDLKDLRFFELDADTRAAAPVQRNERWQDRRVLAQEVRLPDMDVELSVKRLDAAPARLDDLRASARSREGRLAESKFDARLKAGAISGTLGADLRGKTPQLQASLAAKDFDAAGFLAYAGLKVARAKVGTLDARLDLKGASFAEALGASSLRIAAQGLDLTLPAGGDAPRAFAGRAEVSGKDGRLQASASGTLDGQAFSASAAELAALILGAEGPPAELALDAADGLLGLRGALAARAQLKWAAPARYELDRLEVRLGESAFGGRIVADGSGKRPSLAATLAASSLRLRDLGIGAEADPRAAAADPKSGVRTAAGTDWIRLLRSYDAVAELKAEQLRSATELLGSAQAKLDLADGRLRVAPLEIRQGDSVLRGTGEFNAAPATPEYAMQAELTSYNLTPLLHALMADAPGTATLDARTSLRGRGLGKAAIANLQGEVDMAGFGRVSAGKLSALNLMALVLGSLDSDTGSSINCGVAVFDIGDGFMRSRALFVDATRLRLMGNLDIDLATGALAGALQPYAKNPSVFSVNSPVNIGGTFRAPKVALAKGALTGMLVRYSNPYTMFLGSLLDVKSAPPDGTEDCRAAYVRTSEARPEQAGKKRGLR